MVEALVTVDLPEAWQVRLRQDFPEVCFTFAQDPQRILAAAPTAEVILASALSREVVAAAQHLRWVQAATSGVSHLLFSEFRERNVLLTNARTQGVPMAELVLAMMFAFASRLPLFVEARGRRELVAQRAVREKFELHGQTLLICGLGDVGGMLCGKAAGIGMRVIGLRRRPELHCAGAEQVVGVDRLWDVLPRADHVAMTLPLTQGTRGFLGPEEFALLRRGVYLYNVGGGATVDTRSLVQALREERLAGAGLDVTDPDPLPANDPLWAMDNVLLTQHTSGSSPHNNERIAAIFAENLRHYRSGEALRNAVDPVLGY